MELDSPRSAKGSGFTEVEVILDDPAISRFFHTRHDQPHQVMIDEKWFSNDSSIFSLEKSINWACWWPAGVIDQDWYCLAEVSVFTFYGDQPHRHSRPSGSRMILPPCASAAKHSILFSSNSFLIWPVRLRSRRVKPIQKAIALPTLLLYRILRHFSIEERFMLFFLQIWV